MIKQTHYFPWIAITGNVITIGTTSPTTPYFIVSPSKRYLCDVVSTYYKPCCLFLQVSSYQAIASTFDGFWNHSNRYKIEVIWMLTWVMAVKMFMVRGGGRVMEHLRSLLFKSKSISQTQLSMLLLITAKHITGDVCWALQSRLPLPLNSFISQ